MTENKRFKLAYKKGDWWAVRDGEITLWKEEVIHLLNELNEENEELKQENEDLKTSKEYWRKKCLSKDSYNKFHFKPPIWFTQDITLTDKQARKVAKAIEQDLKQRRIKNE